MAAARASSTVLPALPLARATTSLASGQTSAFFSSAMAWAKDSVSGGVSFARFPFEAMLVKSSYSRAVSAIRALKWFGSRAFGLRCSSCGTCVCGWEDEGEATVAASSNAMARARILGITILRSHAALPRAGSN